MKKRNILSSQDKFVFQRTWSTFQIFLPFMTYVGGKKADGVCVRSRNKLVRRNKRNKEERREVGEEK